MKIKFLHLNIEGRKHIDKICDFLKKEEFDLVCAQEVDSDTAIFLSEQFGFEYVFSDFKLRSTGEPRGNAIFSKKGFVSKKDVLLKKIDNETYGYLENRLLSVIIDIDGSVFNIVTCHLPVNYPGNIISPLQMEVFDRLKENLPVSGELFLTGDLNSPRGTFIFDSLANIFVDNVPKDLASSLDPVLHRAPNLNYVVDGIFSTKGYKVSDVVIHTGLSDHKGISGILSLDENKV